MSDFLSLVTRRRPSLWSQCGAICTLHKAGCSLPLSLGKQQLVWMEDKCWDRRAAFQFLGPGVWAPWVPRCLQDVQKGRQAVPGLPSSVLMQAMGWEPPLLVSRNSVLSGGQEEPEAFHFPTHSSLRLSYLSIIVFPSSSSCSRHVLPSRHKLMASLSYHTYIIHTYHICTYIYTYIAYVYII